MILFQIELIIFVQILFKIRETIKQIYISHKYIFDSFNLIIINVKLETTIINYEMFWLYILSLNKNKNISTKI